MIDVNKCRNDGCNLRKTCYRYTIAPSETQSCIVFDNDEDSCYWPNQNITRFMQAEDEQS